MEIIVVDDCSTDDTKTMIADLQQKCNYLFYFRHDKNKGNAFARNTAWKNSKGKYIAFLDDDDYWILDNKISIQVNAFEVASSDNGICCTQAMVDEDGCIKATPEELPYNMRFQILQGNSVIHNSTVMIKREVMIVTGGFDEKMPRGIDSEFFRNVITRFNYKVLFLKIPTIHYETGGHSRITTRKGFKESGKILFAHSYNLWKYRIHYLHEPRALFIRLKNLFLLRK